MVRARPSSNDVRARQPVRRSILSVEPMCRSTCPSRSVTKVFSDDGFPSASSRSEEHTSELQSQSNLVCRLLLEKKKNKPRHAETLPQYLPPSLPSPRHTHATTTYLSRARPASGPQHYTNPYPEDSRTATSNRHG